MSDWEEDSYVGDTVYYPEIEHRQGGFVIKFHRIYFDTDNGDSYTVSVYYTDNCQWIQKNISKNWQFPYGYTKKEAIESLSKSIDEELDEIVARYDTIKQKKDFINRKQEEYSTE